MIPNRAINDVRPLKVIYIGAGVSGIIAAIEICKALPTVELIIYEKNPEIGGTWYENRYPGCACDIPSHSYQLSYESWTEWSQFYSGAPEILQYWKLVAQKYDVRKHIRFNHKCLEAQWDESRSKWKVKLSRSDTEQSELVEDMADILITGTGLLNEWKWPNIEGLHDFKGKLLHTANWDESFDATDKSVAVIGAGSSGIQVVPAIVSQVKSMDHYVRGKTWISTQFGEDELRDRNLRDEQDDRINFHYTSDEKERWKGDRKAYLDYRKRLEFSLQSNYGITQVGSDRSETARALYESNMRKRLASKPEIADHLIPDFPPLCKRITPGPGYLEALSTPHVSVITQPIVRAYADGLETSDGTRRPVDAIICATGFETSPEFGFPILGRDGINLRTKYRHRPRTYLGLCTDNFPNFFQSLGPNSFQGGGSLLIMMEYIHKYIAEIILKIASSNIVTIEPKRRQVDNFTNYCDEYFRKTVFGANCVSWYKTNNRVTALWPGSSVHAIHALKSVRWEDFELEYYDNNDFGWFGNGWAATEEKLEEHQKDAVLWYLEDSRFLHEPRSLLEAAIEPSPGTPLNLVPSDAVANTEPNMSRSNGPGGEHELSPSPAANQELKQTEEHGQQSQAIADESPTAPSGSDSQTSYHIGESSGVDLSTSGHPFHAYHGNTGHGGTVLNGQNSSPLALQELQQTA